MAIICRQHRKSKDSNADKGGFTQMDADATWLNEPSGRVIGCAFTVLNTLGPGFLEKVYENALAHELRKGGIGGHAAIRSHGHIR